MYRYIIIEGKNLIEDQVPIIKTIFSEFMDIQRIEIDHHTMMIYYQHETDISFLDVILNIMSDTFNDLRIYVSYSFDSLEEMKAHQEFIVSKLKVISFNKYIYLDDKIIIKANLNCLNDEIRRFMLRKFSNDQLMLETIKIYLESNLNMVTAAKKLYVHRNTLIQRIDKFFQVTGFDVKNFTDAFLIYHFIK